MAILSFQLLNKVLNLVATAGNILLEIRKKINLFDPKITKNNQSIADLTANEIIIQGLRLITPNLPIISEETELVSFIKRVKWQRFWLVDPLDGTAEFLQNGNDFTVNIALIEFNKPVFGVVYIPISKLCYFGIRGYGAFRQMLDHHDQLTILQAQPLKRPISIVVSKLNTCEKQHHFIKSVRSNSHCFSISSSLKFCYIADGTADLYPRFSPTAQWDTAAAQVIVEMAGCHLISLQDGTPLCYNTTESILNPPFIAYGMHRHCLQYVRYCLDLV